MIGAEMTEGKRDLRLRRADVSKSTNQSVTTGPDRLTVVCFVEDAMICWLFCQGG